MVESEEPDPINDEEPSVDKAYRIETLMPTYDGKDTTAEVAIMKKLDTIADMLNGINANTIVLRSRINAVELGLLELVRTIQGEKE